MKFRGWWFALLTFLVIPFTEASLNSRIASLWHDILYIGGLGFLNLPGSNDIVLFLRFSIGILVFTIMFALGVFLGSDKIQFLKRNHAIVIAAVIALITTIFIPTPVLIAISASFGTLVSFLLLAAPLVALIMIIAFLPDEPCVWDFIKMLLAAMVLWILNLQQVHLTKLTGPANYIPVNEAIDWAALAGLIFFIYYLIKWILCAFSGEDNEENPNYGEAPFDKIKDLFSGGNKNNDREPSSSGGTREGPNGNGPDLNGGTPNPGTGAAGSLGEETKSMFELILKKINALSIDMNKRFEGLEAWLQSIDKNVLLNNKQISEMRTALESIKKDLIKEIEKVVHEEVYVLHEEINKIATQMGILHKETLKFISEKHEEHIKAIERTRKELIERQEKLIEHQEKIVEKIKEITSKIEKIERESVKIETVRELIEHIKEIREKIIIIEKERVGIDKLDIDAIIQILKNLELKVNIEINNNNSNNNSNMNTNRNGGGRSGGGKRKPRGTAALEFTLNGKHIQEQNAKIKGDVGLDLTKSRYTFVKLRNSGTGGIITYHIIERPGLRVNIEHKRGILVIGQHIEFSIQKTPAADKIKKKYQDITIYAKEGNHSGSEKNHHWFKKNKRWHYELNLKIND